MLQTQTGRPSWWSLFGFPLVAALVFGFVAVGMALATGLPLRDPDGLLGPSYVRLPLIVGGMIALDLLPRAAMRARSARRMPVAVVTVFREKWPWSRLAVVAAGLASFYITYVAYRNLKSFLPFVRKDLVDYELVASDLWLAGGNHPAEVLHNLLGTGVTAQVLSFVYVFFLFFVPFSLAAALVWSDKISQGAWYVSALSFNWILGTASYYALPSLGPIYVERFRFEGLPSTGVSGLQRALLRNRVEVLSDPQATQSVQGIAAFASLHVSIVFTAALIAHLVGLPRLVRWALWVFVGMTAVATVYFGWHYLVDVFAGLAVGAIAVGLGYLAVRRRHHVSSERVHEGPGRLPEGHDAPAGAEAGHR